MELFARLVPTAARVAALGLGEDPAPDGSPSGESAETSAPGTATHRLSRLDDAGLVAALREATELSRLAQSVTAVLASEITRRSRPEIGYGGLAQSSGHRTPELMVQSLTGSSYREAARLVSVGTIVAEADARETAPPCSGVDVDAAPASGELTAPSPSWPAAIATAVASGSLSVAAADAILRGLGGPSEGISEQALGAAADVLVAEAHRVALDDLYRRARQLRDQLDSSRVAEREEDRRRQRYLKIGPEIDGMRRIHGLLDPESAAIIVGAFDAVTSPRRGGPRFTDPVEKDRAEAILSDPRTTEQLTLDAFVDMVRIAVDADPGTVFGRNRPGVRVIVTADDLRKSMQGVEGNGAAPVPGIGRIEGQPDDISIHSVHRAICDTGIIPVLIDPAGQPLDVGRRQRLFTHRQRIALGIRDGGCVFPGCDRPPSWCEAHHITPWEEGGRTDTADGVLLCRHHHMLVHNNHWRISREGSRYWLRPPRSHDPKRTLIPLQSKNPSAERWTDERRRRAS